jgi:DNA helicase-2/ATP-dependent DNA helicase PcrA
LDYLNDLNEEQKQAVAHEEGPVMVVAGAGSGKTRVLTYRIAHLMNRGIPAFNILALTFTNKAAREMKDRIGKIVNHTDSQSLWMGTFHSIFAKILRIEHQHLNYPSNFTIYDTQDAQSVISKIIKELQLDKDHYKPKEIYSRISQYKNKLITPKVYFSSPELQQHDAMSKRPLLGDIYQQYCNRCYKSGAMDFDDLLLKTNELFGKFPDVLSKYQDKFQHILVDEYQDTNHSQYIIVRALAQKHKNLCVVGDDAQSIYSFRGANIQNILNFQKDYPEANLFRLERNYRSSKNIVEAANSIIKNNTSQIPKKVWTDNDAGQKIKLFQAHSDLEEASYIAKQIKNKHANNINYDQFAILYRKNAQSRSIEDSLRRSNIPYRIYGGLSFYQRKEIKDITAYIKTSLNPKDDESLLRIINYPSRKIGQTTIDKLVAITNKEGGSILETISKLPEITDHGIQKPTVTRLETFKHMVNAFQSMAVQKSAFETVEYILKSSGIYRALKDEKTPEAITKLENLQEFLNSTQIYTEEQIELEDGNPSLNGFLENITLATDTDTQDDDPNKVSLMTIHAAKGLEFPYLFIVGLEENNFPSFMTIHSKEELEEERRLFYVALTRAEKEAFITFSLSRFQWGRPIDLQPSRFLSEIDSAYLEEEMPKVSYSQEFETDSEKNRDNYLLKKIQKNKTPYPEKEEKNYISTPKECDFSVGDLVKHQRFGAGEVVSFSGQRENIAANIKFKGTGEKKLLLRYAKLKKINI